MMDFQHMLMYVQEALVKNGGEHSRNPAQQFRSRSAHCRRVYEWCRRLIREEQLPGIREDILLTAAIFHDCGYNGSGIPHEKLGAEIFRAYMGVHHPSLDTLTETVAGMILLHSDKALLRAPETPLELILLMEADLLDEEGAMGIVTDCFTLAGSNRFTAEYVRAHLRKNACSIAEQFPMVTPFAKRCWEKKQRIVADFYAAYEEDTLF